MSNSGKEKISWWGPPSDTLGGTQGSNSQGVEADSSSVNAASDHRGGRNRGHGGFGRARGHSSDRSPSTRRGARQPSNHSAHSRTTLGARGVIHGRVEPRKQQNRASTAQQPTRPASVAAQTEQNPPVLIPCPNCDMTGHGLDKCIWGRDMKGLIQACVLCNKADHLTDECSEFVKLTPGEKYRIYVVERENMPGLATSTGYWWDMFWDIFKSQYPTNPIRLPWMPSFAVRATGYKHVPQEELQQWQLPWRATDQYDLTTDKRVLPQDPDTTTIRKFMESVKAQA